MVETVAEMIPRGRGKSLTGSFAVASFIYKRQIVAGISPPVCPSRVPSLSKPIHTDVDISGV